MVNRNLILSLHDQSVEDELNSLFSAGDVAVDDMDINDVSNVDALANAGFVFWKDQIINVQIVDSYVAGGEQGIQFVFDGLIVEG